MEMAIWSPAMLRRNNMKIRKDLYLLSGGYYGQLGNVYGIKYEEGCILFDCGREKSYQTIVENLSYWGMDEGSVTHVFLTHGHDDHGGSAAQFQKNGSKIIVGREDAYMMEQGSFGKDSPFQNHVMPCCSPDVLLEGDQEIKIGSITVRAYHMPGHTDGSCIYLAETAEGSYLFTGDMFICDGEEGNEALIWWKGDLTYSGEKLQKSFARLWSMNLKPDVVAGGHGNPRIGRDAGEMIMIAYKEFLKNHR